MNIPRPHTRVRVRVKEAAAHVGLSVSTLNKMRIAGTGPRFTKAGARCVVYSLIDLDDWMAAHTHTSTAEYDIRTLTASR